MSSHTQIGVLFVQTQTAFGADVAIHARIMRHLDRERFAVHVACASGDSGEPPPPLTALEKIPNLVVRPTRFAPSSKHGRSLRTLRAAAAAPVEFVELRDYVRRHGISVIHGTDRPRDAAYTVGLAKAAGVRSVVHVHVKWSNEYSAPSRWGVKLADAVFGISRFVSETVVASGRPPGRVHTVLNAIDPSEWDPTTDGSGLRRELGLPEGSLVLTSVSRLFSWKGQRELVRSFALVRKRIPNAELLVVGADQEGGAFTRELRALAHELGVGAHVQFTGERADIARVMAASDVFTLPSFEEPFGLVFLEAMVMKKPVVALDNGGTPEVVEHGRSGLLSPPWDVEGFAENAIRLLEQPELRRRMGEQARARVLEHFTANRMAADAASAYEAILER